MRTLFLNPPSYEGFDGGAGSRYQARREIRSYWYPTWLAQPAALVPDSLLIDAPPAGKTLADVAPLAGDFELAVAPERSLLAAPAVDFVAREEFDYTLAEVAQGRPLADVAGLSFRGRDGGVVHNPDRPVLEDMDRLPFVTAVYKRDLRVEDYYIGYLRHPYVSLYTGRGCRSRCTFCLWPQTVGGHRYRTRSVASVLEEAALARELFPQMRELFFDDDTFTDDRRRAEQIARGLGRLGMTWSCNAKANVPYETLAVMRDNGLRVERARRFAADCRQLGITVHGTFILGLPGETRETIRETIAFAREVNPHTIQVSVAAPYPGTELYRQAKEHGWLPDDADGVGAILR
jgi:radical SAM superfamily enzyme YgiQ (UPF0313 family)